jgi:hypothetical protein
MYSHLNPEAPRDDGTHPTGNSVALNLNLLRRVMPGRREPNHAPGV